jgi:hypothetical protein
MIKIIEDLGSVAVYRFTSFCPNCGGKWEFNKRSPVRCTDCMSKITPRTSSLINNPLYRAIYYECGVHIQDLSRCW